MQIIYTIFGVPLGLLMWLVYKVIPNYGLALIVCTILVRVISFPLSIKQQKNNAKMAIINPKMQELQKKYGNDKEKYAAEVQKLHKEENYSMGGGCVTMLIPMLLLFGFYDVVYNPLTHILRMPKEKITAVFDLLNKNGAAIKEGFGSQISIINIINNPEGTGILNGISEIAGKYMDKIQSFDLNFLGINLGEKPEWTFSVLLLIPILSAVTALISSIISMEINKRNGLAQVGGTMKGMMLIMPLFSFFIAFNVPAGVGLYWIINNVTMFGQTILLNKMYNPKELAEKARLESEAKKKEKKKVVVETVVVNEHGDKTVKEETISQKELNRRRLAEARKRAAEKYGDEYSEED